jgi:hypothetical protein
LAAGRDVRPFLLGCVRGFFNLSSLNKAGTLEYTNTLKPDMHIWTASKQPWIVIPEDVEAFDKNPS